MLDLVFTKFPDTVSAIKLLAPLGNSDHTLLSFTTDLYDSQEPTRPRSSRRKYETSIASLATSNTKVFFAHVRRNRQLNRQIISLKTALGVNVKEPEMQAELLNEFYDAAFGTDNGQPFPALLIPSEMMSIPVFTLCLVLEELSTFDTS